MTLAPRVRKPNTAINLMAKQEGPDVSEASEEGFAAKPEMNIFTLVDDDSDDELGDVDTHSLQYMRKKHHERNLVHQVCIIWY